MSGSGESALTGCRISGTITGPALAGIRTVADSAIFNNDGGGLDDAVAVNGAYVAENRGVGITGAAVSASSVLGNTDIGILNPVSVSNSWIVANGGIGIRGANNAHSVSDTASGPDSGRASRPRRGRSGTGRQRRWND